MSNPKIEMLEHTADLAVRISAANEIELFELGAAAVYELIGPPVPAEGEAKPCHLLLQAGGEEELFHDWLAEILYWFQVRQTFFERFDFETLRPTLLRATAHGRKIDVEKSTFHVEIKAVTYHHLRIEHRPQGLTATVIFDI